MIIVSTLRDTAAIVILIASLAPAFAQADGSAGRRRSVDRNPIGAQLIELKPGHTVTVLAGQEIQAISIGNPAVADANVIAVGGGIAINGRGVGTTNLTAFDETGKALGNMTIQVVGGSDLRAVAPQPRNDIRVRSLMNGMDRAFICDVGCTHIPRAAGSPPPVGSKDETGGTEEAAASALGAALGGALAPPSRGGGGNGGTPGGTRNNAGGTGDNAGGGAGNR